MKILLMCNAGMSTSLLVERMREFAKEGDEINAVSEVERSIIGDYDVLLIGPQIRYKLKSLAKDCEELGMPCAVIDMIAYGQVNGQAVYNHACELYKGYYEN